MTPLARRALTLVALALLNGCSSLGYYSQLANAQGGQAIVNVHRGQIGKALAERWFLPLDGSARQQAPQPVQ